MKLFKFFKGYENINPEPVNEYMGFDMDWCLIRVIRQKMQTNQDILYNDTDLSDFNYPFTNCFIRITNWNNWGSDPLHLYMVDIKYKIIETNIGSHDFTLSIERGELNRRIEYDVL